MIKISNAEITSLGITPTQCVEWVREAFCMKYESQLPPKISLHPQGNDFFNTMPCLLPSLYDQFGVKIVSRIAGNHPSLHSDLLLYKASTGELQAYFEADWVTQMRTGAVAALAIDTLRNNNAHIYAFVGLGSTATATMECLLPLLNGKQIICKLLRYKQQAEAFVQRFANHKNIEFEIVDTHEDLIRDADVLVSCVTDMNTLFCNEETLFKKGILIVPVHTKGFQNCDLFFDTIVVDDIGHVSGFKNFKSFKQTLEISEILLGRVSARPNSDARILAYNIGLGLHDVFFAHKILELIKIKTTKII